MAIVVRAARGLSIPARATQPGPEPDGGAAAGLAHGGGVAAWPPKETARDEGCVAAHQAAIHAAQARCSRWCSLAAPDVERAIGEIETFDTADEGLPPASSSPTGGSGRSRPRARAAPVRHRLTRLGAAARHCRARPGWPDQARPGRRHGDERCAIHGGPSHARARACIAVHRPHSFGDLLEDAAHGRWLVRGGPRLAGIFYVPAPRPPPAAGAWPRRVNGQLRPGPGRGATDSTCQVEDNEAARAMARPLRCRAPLSLSRYRSSTSGRVSLRRTADARTGGRGLIHLVDPVAEQEDEGVGPPAVARALSRSRRWGDR